MDVYIFQADIYCRDCGESLRRENPLPPGADLDDESTFDSDAYPKGPYGDGGGEADCPQHCGACNLFLDNPLTGDGETYVRDIFRLHVETGRGNAEVIADWRLAYDWVWDDFESITLEMMREEKPLTPAQESRLAALADL